MDSFLESRLESGSRVVTSTQRLARHLAFQFALSQPASGRAVWTSPNIIPVNAWLSRCWGQRQWSGDDAGKTLISQAQSLVVWQDIVRRRFFEMDGNGHGLVQPSALATAAARSRSLILQYEIPVAALTSFPNRETQAFLHWLRDYDAVCDKHGWIDADGLPMALAGLATNDINESVTESIVLAGFDDHPPAMNSLLTALETAGWEVHHWMPGVAEPQVLKTSCRDPRDEIRYAARWLRQFVDQNPGARAGIVIPDLDAGFEMVWRECTEVFDAAALLPGGNDRPSPFHIARSRNLSDVPVIQTALKILSLGAHRIEFNDLSRLLRSPHIGSGHYDHSANLELDVWLREHDIDHIDLKNLARIAKRPGMACSDLAQRLQDFQASADLDLASLMPGSWAAKFGSWLRIMGWPGDDADSPAVARLLDVITRFGSLDLTASAMDLDAALAALAQMLRLTPFQPPGPESCIEITTPDEAAGFEFDCLWITSLDDSLWPAAQKADPFIPVSVQREHNVERADSGLRLEKVRQVQNRLIASSRQVVMSWSRRRDDREMRPSPLLPDCDYQEPITLLQSPVVGVARQIFETRVMEFIHDDRPPPLVRKALVKGGARVLELQSACPFRAFAELRLNAIDLERPVPGLNARLRGALVHRALEFFWKATGDQATLLDLDDGALQTRIRNSVDQAVGTYARSGNPLRRRLLDIEKTRIAALITDIVVLEKQRPPFRVIGPEQARCVELEHIQLNLRIDRVDQLDDGREVVLDYKTGKVGTNEWFGDRLPKPQLPLYSVSSASQPAAVAYVSLRAGDVGFKGVAADDGLLPGVGEFTPSSKMPDACSDWSQVQAYWKNNLDVLAREFRDGRADVDPARHACDFCHLSALCRVDELAARETVDDQID